MIWDGAFVYSIYDLIGFTNCLTKHMPCPRYHMEPNSWLTASSFIPFYILGRALQSFQIDILDVLNTGYYGNQDQTLPSSFSLIM